MKLSAEQRVEEMWKVAGSPIERALLKAILYAAVEGRGWNVSTWWPCPRCFEAHRAARSERDIYDVGPDPALDCGQCLGGFGVMTFGKARNPGQTLTLWLQKQLGPHRVDFLAEMEVVQLQSDKPGCNWESWPYVLECDGHEWHSSREQRTRDAGRDRYLTEHGYRVLRYTGTEIHEDPRACADNLLHIIEAQPRRRWDWREIDGQGGGS